MTNTDEPGQSPIFYNIALHHPNWWGKTDPIGTGRNLAFLSKVFVFVYIESREDEQPIIRPNVTIVTLLQKPHS